MVLSRILRVQPEALALNVLYIEFYLMLKGNV